MPKKDGSMDKNQGLGQFEPAGNLGPVEAPASMRTVSTRCLVTRGSLHRSFRVLQISASTLNARRQMFPPKLLTSSDVQRGFQYRSVSK